MYSTNMLAMGSEIYMKCLLELKQQQSPDVSSAMPSNNVQYYVPPYAQNGQPLAYMQNPHSPHIVQMPLAVRNETSTLPVKNDFTHDQQYSPFNQYGPQQIQNYPSNGMDHQNYQNVNYGLQVLPNEKCASSTAIPSPVTVEKLKTTESKGQLRHNVEQMLPVQSPKDQNEVNQLTANPNKATPSIAVNSKPENTKPEPDAKNKIRRPMNSFMLYAKRNRTRVQKLYPMCDNRTVSKILSDTWYAMDPVNKQKYHEFADHMRDEHFRKYPDYKWKSSSNLAGSGDNGSKKTATGISGLPVTPSTESSLSPIKYESCTAEPRTEFRLGPTPAQLGRKRKTAKMMGTSDGSMAQNKNMEDDFPFGQTEFKQRMQALPQFDFSTYRMTNDWDLSPRSPSMTYNTYSRKRAQSKQPANEQHHAKRLVGDRFFGPDFNVNNFKGLDVNSPNSSPATPSSTEDHHHNNGQNKTQEKKRDLLSQRKTLIMALFQKCGFFPSSKDLDDFLKEHKYWFNSKSVLNVKIREYRQKLMHQSPTQ